MEETPTNEELNQAIQLVINGLNRQERSRENSIIITKLEESQLWLVKKESESESA